MITITGLKEHQQSRLMQHYATIESWRETLEVGLRDSVSPARMHEIEHNIENEKEGIRQVINQSKKPAESVDEFIDGVLKVIFEIEKYLDLLPDDIEVVVRAVINQIKKILLFAKELF